MERVTQDPGTKQTLRHRSDRESPLPGWSDWGSSGAPDMCWTHSGSGPGRWHIPVPTFGVLPGYKASIGGVAVLWHEQPGEPAFHLAFGPSHLRGCLGTGLVSESLWVWHKFSYPCPYPILELIFIVSTAPKLTHTFWVIPPSWGWPRLSLWDATAPRPSHPSLSLLTHIFRFD